MPRHLTIFAAAMLASLSACLFGCRADAPRPATTAETPPAAHESSVAPGINKSYEGADVDKFTERFESESREVYTERERIVADIAPPPGAAIADIGAGTGFYTVLFAHAVGPQGKVYAVDITPEFVGHIQQRAADEKLNNVEAVLCKEDSVELPPDSIDLAFICDTYHHFEYPRSTLASLHRALRRGGEVIVIDFIREEGVSRDWVLEHVRAGQAAVVAEFSEAGFDLVSEGANTAELTENYFLRFRKRD